MVTVSSLCQLVRRTNYHSPASYLHQGSLILRTMNGGSVNEIVTITEQRIPEGQLRFLYKQLAEAVKSSCQAHVLDECRGREIVERIFELLARTCSSPSEQRKRLAEEVGLIVGAITADSDAYTHYLSLTESGERDRFLSELSDRHKAYKEKRKKVFECILDVHR